MVENEWFERGVFVLILANTLCLSVTRYDQPVTEVAVLNAINVVFTVVFTVEALMKILAFGNGYFRESWNVFDFTVVVVAWTEIVIALIEPEDSPYLTGVRALRILRIVRMFKTWQTMHKYLIQLYHCVQSAGPPFVLLSVVMFAFSLCGLQFFGGRLHYDEALVLAGDLQRECPEVNLPYYPYCPKRENFDTFGSSWVACFQVITGEIVVVFASIEAISYLTLVFYLALVVVGVFLLINVFLVVLMQAFSSSVDEADLHRHKLSLPTAAKVVHALLQMRKRARARLIRKATRLGRGGTGAEKPLGSPRSQTSIVCRTVPSTHPSAPYKSLHILPWEHPLRSACAQVATSRWFDRSILVLIVASCVLIAIDAGATCRHAPAYAGFSPVWSPRTCEALAYLDLLFNFIFVVEAAVKIVAFGLSGHPGRLCVHYVCEVCCEAMD